MDSTTPLDKRETPASPPGPRLAGIGASCAACESPLSADQRYCLECGERSGPARLPAVAGPSRAPVVLRSTGPRQTPGTMLIAGIATLLLALGIGVLIGRGSAGNSNAKPPADRIVYVPAAAGTAATAPPATGATTTPTTPSTTPAPAATTPSKTPPPAGKAPAAAPAKKPANNPTGVQNGKFTGNFFGG